MLYRTINSGKNQRREYLGRNRSPLFQDLPQKDFGQEQKSSYENFLHRQLVNLFTDYFPVESSNYNNNIQCNVKQVSYQETSISEDEARYNSLTWSYSVYLLWSFAWNCHRIQIPLEFSPQEKKSKSEEEIAASKNFTITQWVEKWVEKSFKIGLFTLQEKLVAQQWEVKEKKGKLKIVIDVLERLEKELTVKFYCEGEKKVSFCELPKITSAGSFIINGHDKVVIFQSVRAPSLYFFSSENNEEVYGEIIPIKGPWVRLSFSKKKPGVIELKFLNSGLVINLLDLFKTFGVTSEVLAQLFSKEDLDIEDYPNRKDLEIGVSLPHFLFDKTNSYFILGRLGRKKFNQKSNILRQVVGQTLAENLYDVNGKLLLAGGVVFQEQNLEILTRALAEEKISSYTLPFSTDNLYSLKIKSPSQPEKIISILGFGKDLPEEKTYFDLADLVCTVSLYCNLCHGLGNKEKEEERDKLENQVIRRVGDLIYNKFENRLGSFCSNINRKYLTYLSRFKKTDLTKIPSLKDFDSLLQNFFNTSPLVQLQNQNNPLSQISYTQKLSSYGEGGFKVPTLSARNVNSSHYGRYDLVETPEGQRVGLIHNLTIQAKINDYGQITVPYYQVREGRIVSQKVYLSSEEEWDKYITHCDIKISEDNEILEEKILARFRNNFVWVTKERIDYIDATFYQLNSITSATIPFFQHNDAARMLMATNMQRQAVPLLRNQEPWVASGVEASVGENTPLVIRAEKKGQVDYVDGQKIVIRESAQVKNTYNLKQLVVSNKNILNFSSPLVKKGEKIVPGQIIANGNYAKNNELTLGYNLRVAYCCWKGYNYEDAIVISERLVKEDILTSLFVKKHTISCYNTEHGPEIFTANLPYSQPNQFPHLDKEGVVKIGSKVKENDILVGKVTPQPHLAKETEEFSLLLKIFGEKTQHFVNSSLYLPAGEEGIVYDIRRKKLQKNKKELEMVEVYVGHKRKIEVGDKLITRFGNKGVVGKIVPEADMPFDEEGKPIDIIFNPLSVPSRMNVGQLLETIFSEVSSRLNVKLLFRPFNTLSSETIHQLINQTNIKKNGVQKLFDGQTGLPFQHDIYTGYIYTIKLNHMVTDKIHARNTGPYSLIYQQPLKGRSQGGGQRVGEMEAWGLEAHGAAFNLMETMSAKSDDIYKRRLMQNNLIFGNQQVNLHSSQNESFNILLQYSAALGFLLTATDYRNKEIDLRSKFFTSN